MNKQIDLNEFSNYVCELELMELSNKSLIEKFGKTNKSARSKYYFELQKFESHGYYCKAKQVR